ncbi:lamin tail domain-containing protein [Actinoplanes sp. NPDC089786]|uniref:lamin tail domain-containing protein n=1 Tax=Actinoplanes sp. NPDC089786 TaxID=3155185 RepID=UPI0034248F1F
MRVRSPRLVAALAAAGIGLGSALLGAGPAMAATVPTLTGPASVVGWNWATLHGKADPGATIRLREAAYVYRDDMYYSEAFFPEDVVTATADANGDFTLRRRLDSGFVFVAEANNTVALRSAPLYVGIVPKPTLELSVSGTNVSVRVVSEPGQAFLPVKIQRQSGSTWQTLVEGQTETEGVYQTVLTGQSGAQNYRASVGPDDANRVLVGNSVVVGINGGQPNPPTDPTTPPTTPTKPPTTTPTKPPVKPAPAPLVVKPGDVRFSLIVFDPAGKDTTSKLNQEYFRITNYTSKTFNLKYWTVKDRAGNTYRFTTDFYLRGKKNVYIPTGKGTNGRPSNYRYWGRKGFIWDNGGDSAYLRTGTSKLIDSCRYTKNSKGKTYC